MAVFYVRSTTGLDTRDGSTWALAKASITNALSVASAGDTIYVSQAHNYSTTAITYTCVNSNITVVCVNDSAQPPTQLATTASETSTTGNITFPICRMAWYGIAFKSAVSINYASGVYQTFENCTFQLNSTTSGTWTFNPTVAQGNYHVMFINSIFKTNYSGSSFAFSNSYTATTYTTWPVQATVLLQGCTFIGTAPINLFTWNTLYALTTIILDGCDLSILGADSALFSNNVNISSGSKIYVRNCKLASNVSILRYAITGIEAPDIFLENCDSESSNVRSEWYKYQGSVINNTVITRLGGASNGTRSFSWAMNANLYSTSLFPLTSPVISTWCGTVGSTRAAIVEFAHNSTVPIGSNELWADLEYQSSGTSTLGTFLRTNSTTYPLTINTIVYSQSTGVKWSPFLVNPCYQKIQIQFTPQIQGLLNIRFYLAKQNYTVYVDPMITLV